MHSAGYLTGITNPTRLGRAVRQVRKECGMTQQQVAEAAGVSRLCVRDLETGKRSVGSANVIRILRSLGHEMVIRPRNTPTMADRASGRPQDSQ